VPRTAVGASTVRNSAGFPPVNRALAIDTRSVSEGLDVTSDGRVAGGEGRLDAVRSVTPRVVEFRAGNVLDRMCIVR
jgi:hypothetical protein